MKGICKRISAGHIELRSTKQIIEIIDNEGVVFDHIEYEKLDGQSWGYVYEKIVGQHLIDNGYDVEFNGLKYGFNDGGIDLIARRFDHTKYIQCKYRKGIKKADLEEVLWKASNWLTKRVLDKNPIFAISVHSIEYGFGKIDAKSKSQLPPLAEYFLSKNQSQKFIKVEILEVEMNRFDNNDEQLIVDNSGKANTQLVMKKSTHSIGFEMFQQNQQI